VTEEQATLESIQSGLEANAAMLGQAAAQLAAEGDADRAGAIARRAAGYGLTALRMREDIPQ